MERFRLKMVCFKQLFFTTNDFVQMKFIIFNFTILKLKETNVAFLFLRAQVLFLFALAMSMMMLL